LHRRRFRICADRTVAAAAGESVVFEDGLRGGSRQKQIGGRVVSLLDSGLSPIEIVGRLWRRHDLDLPHIYRGVMQVVQVVRSQGAVEEIPG
jgi:hypothetical protein